MHFVWADLERQKLLLDNYTHKPSSVFVAHWSLSVIEPNPGPAEICGKPLALDVFLFILFFIFLWPSKL